jgi:hypothetical protein
MEIASLKYNALELSRWHLHPFPALGIMHIFSSKQFNGTAMCSESSDIMSITL